MLAAGWRALHSPSVKLGPALFVPIAIVSLAACGGASPEPAAPTSVASPAKGAPTSAEPPLGPNQIRRRDLMATLSAGPGAFLQRIDVAPALSGGRFHGWRIVAMRGGAEAWGKADLQPGDVVTSVNGYPIERPEQAIVPWRSLAIANELRVGYERDGKPRELRYDIQDDAGAPAQPDAKRTP